MSLNAQQLSPVQNTWLHHTGALVDTDKAQQVFMPERETQLLNRGEGASFRNRCSATKVTMWFAIATAVALQPTLQLSEDACGSGQSDKLRSEGARISQSHTHTHTC